MSSPPRPSLPRGPVLRAASWAGAVTLAGLVSLYVAAAAVVDAAFVEERLSRGLSSDLPGASVEVGAVRLLPHRLGLAVRSLRIEAGAAPGGSDSSSGPRGGWTLSVPRLTITGIEASSLPGASLSAGQLRLEAPRLARDAPSGSSSAPREPGIAPADSSPPGGETSAPRGRVHVERVRITGATLDLSAVAPASFVTGVANGLDLDLRDLSLAGGRPPDADALVASMTRLRVPSYRARSSDARSFFRVEGIEVDVESGAARIDEVGLLATTPAVPPPFRAERGETAEDTTALTLDGLAVAGMTVDTAGSRSSLRARSVEIDSFRVAVVDGVVPDTSVARARLLTPVQRTRNLGWPAGHLDTVSFRHGRVRYTERRVGHQESGTVLFDRIEGSVRLLPFGPRPPDDEASGGREDGAPGTVSLEARGRIARAAPLWIWISIPDRRQGLFFDASGGVAALDLQELNSIFRPIEGIRIQSGRLDSLRFRLRVRSGEATGEVVPVYDDLSISLEDPRAGGRGLDERLRSLVLGLRLNARNHPDDGSDFRTGSVEYVASPGQTFPSFLWQALLTGLQDAAGM